MPEFIHRRQVFLPQVDLFYIEIFQRPLSLLEIGYRVAEEDEGIHPYYQSRSDH